MADHEINQHQLDIITKLVKNGQLMCALLEPLETDSIAERADLAGHLFEAETLVTMGFFVDYSQTAKFKDQIANDIAAGKRGWRIYGLTEIALMLFSMGQEAIQ
jgi:hypothetical protein